MTAREVARLARQLAHALMAADQAAQWKFDHETVCLEIWSRMEVYMRILKAAHEPQHPDDVPAGGV